MLDFPRLTPGRWDKTSDPDVNYNCIAWAAGDQTRWWEPADFCYWPQAAPRLYSVEALIAAYGSIGYENCDDPSLDPKLVEKIAVYATDGIYRHAARQLADGRWTSKLGRNIDIWHDTPDAVEGPKYGTVVRYMARRREA